MNQLQEIQHYKSLYGIALSLPKLVDRDGWLVLGCPSSIREHINENVGDVPDNLTQLVINIMSEIQLDSYTEGVGETRWSEANGLYLLSEAYLQKFKKYQIPQEALYLVADCYILMTVLLSIPIITTTDTQDEIRVRGNVIKINIPGKTTGYFPMSYQALDTPRNRAIFDRLYSRIPRHIRPHIPKKNFEELIQSFDYPEF